MKELKIYEFQAKQIEDTFRLVARTLESKSKTTSLDRDVMQSWEMIKNVLAEKIDVHVPRMQLLAITINMYTKCNTKMKQLTENYSIRLNKKQHETLQILKTYNVNISNFIRLAIKEKLQRDWKQIKEKKEKIKLPF